MNYFGGDDGNRTRVQNIRPQDFLQA